MNRFRAQTLFLPSVLILLAASLCLNGILAHQLRLNQTVVTVFDGDSFELNDGTRVRLLGVDAPETGRCMAEESKALLTTLVLGKRVRLKQTIVDSYGRSVSAVFREDGYTWVRELWRNLLMLFRADAGAVSDRMVNSTMVRAGLARDLSVSGAYKEAIHQASVLAKAENLGIYSTQCRNAFHPDGCDIKGNIRGGVKQYFIPGCKPYGNVIVDESFGDRWFCSEREAGGEGFTKALTCR